MALSAIDAGDSPTRSAQFGWIAIALGFVAFAGVVGHFVAGPIDPPPPVEVSIAKKAVDIRDATIAALKGEEYEAESELPPKTVDDYLTYSFIGLAALAILMAVVGFVRRESLRANIAGAALGGLAITFQVAITMFFVLICAIVLSAVIDKLDFDF